ncbi:MAG: alpha-hydroxy acid oxidase [Candidatus Binatia bacterium]
MVEKPLEQMGRRELRELARRGMPREAWEHFNGAAETRATLRRNQRVFHRFLFRQKIFHEVTNPDTTMDLFGHTLPLPAIVAPIGSLSLIRETAEREVAEGAGRVGTMLFVSQAAKATPQDWREATDTPLVFMAYMSRGREEVLQNAKLAEELNYAAIGITMDVVCPVKLGDQIPLSTKDGKPRRGQLASPNDITWLKRQVPLPIVVKGIMSADDARVAVNAGADALSVSNHGGRLLDYNRAALEALPEVIEAVGSKVPVLLDSGIRSGGDLVKALALGAKAVLVGRPVAWGVGAAGSQGVERVFQIFTEEVKRVLVMTGIPAISEITESILIRD